MTAIDVSLYNIIVASSIYLLVILISYKLNFTLGAQLEQKKNYNYFEVVASIRAVR